MLAKAGINILCTHATSKSNALHIAVERKYPQVVHQLITSGFPLNDVKTGGLTALHIACSETDKESTQIAKMLIRYRADINVVNDDGISALSEAVLKKNHEVVEVLLKKGANIYFSDKELRDKSPFFQAINTQSIVAVEMFCDHGADLNV